MKVAQFFFFGVAGWCAIGIGGVFLSLARGRRAEAIKHASSLAVVAGIYLLLLLAVSFVQKQNVLEMGQDQCFDDMCFAVVAVDEVPSLVAGDDARVVRVAIRVTNHGRSAESDQTIEACVVDSRGKVSQPLPGLSGNRLNARVAGGSQMQSQPMFRVAKVSTGLGLIFTHGSWQPGRLILGNSDSLAHRPTIVALGK